MHRLAIVALLLCSGFAVAEAATFEGEEMVLQLPEEGWQWSAPDDEALHLRGVREHDDVQVELRAPAISTRIGLSDAWVQSLVNGFREEGWEIEAQQQGRIDGAPYLDLVLTQPPRTQFIRLLPANGKLYRLSAWSEHTSPAEDAQVQQLFKSWTFTRPPQAHEITMSSGWGKALGIAMLVVLLGAVYQFLHLRRVRLGRDPRRSRYDPPLKRGR